MRLFTASLALLLVGIFLVSQSGAQFSIIKTARGVDVLLVAGNSNAGGGGTISCADLPAHLIPTNPNLQIWTQTGVAGGPGWATQQNCMNTASWIYDNTYMGMPLNVWGPEAEFAYRYSQDFPTRSLYTMKYYESGTTLAVAAGDDWNAASVGKLFDGMTTQSKAAQNAIAALHPSAIYMIFVNGEIDAMDLTDANAYAANIAAFITGVRGRMGASNLQMILGRVRQQYTYSTIVRAAQDGAASATVHVINTDSYPLQGDGVHYTGDPGQVLLGGDSYNSVLP